MKKGILCLLLLFSMNSLFSQSIPLEIINVDRTSVDETLYPGAQKLSGNVHFKQGDAHLYCDSGFYYSAQNRLLALGKVRLIQGDFKGTCNELDYSGNSRTAILNGGVQLSEGNQRLRTRKVEYRTDTRVGSYSLKGQIDAPGLRASSDSGYFYRDQSLVILVGNARVEEQDLKIQSDSIGYQNKKEEVLFYKNTRFVNGNQKGWCNGGFYSKLNQTGRIIDQVKIIDSAGNILKCDTFQWDNLRQTQEVLGKFTFQDSSKSQFIRAAYLKRWNRLDSFLVTQNVLLSLIDNQDTTYLLTDTLLSNKNDFWGFPVNHFKNDSLIGKCGRLKYHKMDSSIFLDENPMIWNGDLQISAKNMVQKKINLEQFLSCNDSSFIIQWVDCCHLNQIKSDSMILRSYDNQRSLNALGNVKTIYYDVSDKRIERETEVTSSSLVLKWEGSKIKKISYQKNSNIRIQRPEKAGKNLDGTNPQREQYYKELNHWSKINCTY